MKCSNCSEVVRPVVAIDIDGTLGDYHGHFQEFAELWLGREMEPGFEYDGRQSHRSWFCEAFDTDATTFRAIKLAYRQGGMKRSMPPFPGAAPLVNGLRERAEVWLTTTRPHDRFDRVDPDTREWLRRNNIGYDGLLYSGDKMRELAARVEPERVCFVFDDLVETLLEAEGLFPSGSTVLRASRYNEAGPGWIFAVANLLDARAMATAHVQDWTVRHTFDELPTTEG